MTAPGKVRLTVDVDPDQYEALNAWTRKAAADLRVTRVTTTDALRAMIAVTIEDDEMAAAVQTELVGPKWSAGRRTS